MVLSEPEEELREEHGPHHLEPVFDEEVFHEAYLERKRRVRIDSSYFTLRHDLINERKRQFPKTPHSSLFIIVVRFTTMNRDLLDAVCWTPRNYL